MAELGRSVREIKPTVYAMPDRFVPKDAGGGGNWLLIVIVLIVLALVAGGLIFYFRQADRTESLANATNQPITNTTNTNTTQLVLVDQTISADGSTIRTPAAWQPVTNVLPDVILQVANPVADTDSDGSSFAATITVSRSTTASATVAAHVTSVLEDFQRRYADFSIVSQRSLTLAGREAMQVEATYTSSEAPLHVTAVYLLSDTTVYTITAAALAERYAAYQSDFETVVTSFRPPATLSTTNTTVIGNTNTVTNTSPTPMVGSTPLPLANDTDSDGLTAREETLYGTDPAKPDSDGDGFIDGYQLSASGVLSGEVALGYNPSGTGRLKDTALVSGYSNASHNYSLVYPASWSVDTVVSDNSNILISPVPADSGEFFHVIVQANPKEQSALQWYLSLNPSANQATLEALSINGIEGVRTPDRSTVYLAKADMVYIIYYSSGTLTSVNFRASFELMLQSFKLTAPATNTS